jgi:hypothetical protein
MPVLLPIAANDPNHRALDIANLSLGPRDESEVLKNVTYFWHLSTSPPCAALVLTPHSIIFVGMGSFDEKGDEKLSPVSIDSKEVDTGAQLDASLHAPLDPAEALRIRCVRVRRTLYHTYNLNEGGK